VVGLGSTPLFIVDGIEIYVPEKSFVSMFSSPYTSHVHGSAIDISNAVEFGMEVFSPVRGVVEKVLEVEAPPGPFREKDYIISVAPYGNSNRRVKIMHVYPEVKARENIDIDDVIGKYIRTNFFEYHTLPHMHIEVCKDSTLRPSSAVKVAIQLHEIFHKTSTTLNNDVSNIKAYVVAVGDGFILAGERNSVAGFMETLPFSQCRVLINGEISPNSDYIGVINEYCTPYIDEILYIQQIPIGFIKYIDKQYSIVLPSNVSFNHWLRARAASSIAKKSRGFLLNHKIKIDVKGCGDISNIIGIEFLISFIAQIKIIFRQGVEPRCGKEIEISFKL
jgi:hypothetical protein